MTADRTPTRAASASIAIGVATAFIALAALLSFADDPSDHVAGWRLRGTIAPDGVGGAPARLPAAPKRA